MMSEPSFASSRDDVHALSWTDAVVATAADSTARTMSAPSSFTVHSVVLYLRTLSYLAASLQLFAFAGRTQCKEHRHGGLLLGLWLSCIALADSAAGPRWRYYMDLLSAMVAIVASVSLVRIISNVLVASSDVSTTTRSLQLQLARSSAAKSQLQKAKVVASTESAQKDSFFATITHELRTPLTAIVMSLELLSDSTLDAGQRDTLSHAQSASRTLLALINTVLDYSKLSAGAIEMDLHPVRVGDVLGDVRSIGSNLGRGVELIVGGYDGPLVVADSLRLKQILTNLVSNSCKFTSPGGSVRVWTTWKVTKMAGGKEGVEIEFQVKDTGIGMSPKTLERLFHPFMQASRSTSRLFGGTGLGLCIVKRLADAMSGTLNVTSTENVGTTFSLRVSFPLAPPPPPAVVLSPSPNVSINPILNGSTTEKVRILVAEDNPITQTLLRRMLSEFAVVDVVGDGAAARDRIRDDETGFTVLFCDYNMPVMDGLEATRAIRRLERGGSDVWIVGLTANCSKQDEDRCLQAGMNDFVAKPFSKADLIAAVGRAQTVLASKQRPPQPHQQQPPLQQPRLPTSLPTR
ncbi:hypothetical protein HKX48_007881 [Thoreauomyces humboldtii]|nr:hypothetical protein HKX48_007881 [Thoreauomyces humboldtii]